ncbi:MAG: DUF4276 family protein [Saprospiraceae bacterium]|nr:DUF4276 family protein [Saprospiraceae bacterium]
MKRINIICEGPTEEQFVKRMLYRHFFDSGIVVSASSLDGGFNYESLKHHIIQMLNSDKEAYVTTLVDLYGIKGHYPGYEANKKKEALVKVKAIEAEILTDILAAKKLHNKKFIPYLQLHEFEALLFSDPAVLEEWLSLDRELPAGCFANILEQFPSPEHINDNPLTAPSKRIIALAAYYGKIDDGVSVADEIGLATIVKNALISMIG